MGWVLKTDPKTGALREFHGDIRAYNRHAVEAADDYKERPGRIIKYEEPLEISYVERREGIFHMPDILPEGLPVPHENRNTDALLWPTVEKLNEIRRRNGLPELDENLQLLKS